MENKKEEHHIHHQHKHYQHNGHEHPYVKHPHEEHSKMQHIPQPMPSNFRLALSATLHCLLGCGIGEVVGMIITTAMNLNNVPSMIISILLGFVAGITLGVRPLRRHGFPFSKAFKTVVIGEGLSIAVMEAFEALTEASIPGVMNARINESIFWVGMFASLIVGFFAALPINYLLVKRGVRHQH